MPDRWSGSLQSDRDERNEIFGAARGGLSYFSLLWERNNMVRFSLLEQTPCRRKF